MKELEDLTEATSDPTIWNIVSDGGLTDLESYGSALTVTDMGMVECISMMASHEGIYSTPEGVATLAALKFLLGTNKINPDEKVVLMNTGNTYKYLDMWS